jgi:hypothetical protein
MEVVMKAMKSLLLVLCLLSAFSVAAYAGSSGVSSHASPSNPGVSNVKYFFLPAGQDSVTVNWSCHVEVANCLQSGSGSAFVQICDSYGNVNKTLSVSFSGGGYEVQDDAGAFLNTDDWNAMYMETDATFSGAMGGATAWIYASW